MLFCKSERPQKFKPLVDSHSAKTDSFDWSSFFYRVHICTIDVKKGLSGVHSDTSAANICKLRQWRGQQPSCLPHIVLDDRLLVINCNVICECSVTATREGCLLVQLKQPATQILKALLLQQRRWDRPLGTAHFANSDKSAAIICKLWQWRSWRTGRRWECNMRMQYHCDKKRIPFDAIEIASYTQG